MSKQFYIELYGRAFRQFEKEITFRLGTGVEYLTSNCMGRAVRQFEIRS